MQAVVIAEPVAETIEQGQASAWTLGHGGGDGPVEPDHRIAGHAFQQAVEGSGSRTRRVAVAGRLVVESGDGGVHLVLAHLAPPKGLGDEGHPLRDEVGSGALNTSHLDGLADRHPLGPGAADA